jgi:hypothetical protein
MKTIKDRFLQQKTPINQNETYTRFNIKPLFAITVALIVALTQIGVSSEALANETLYTEDEYVYSLEKTYEKFMQEHDGKEISYLNVVKDNYYNTTILKKTGEYYSITQEKNVNKWIYQTLQCKAMTQEQETEGEVSCLEKTSEKPVWVSKTVTNPKSTIGWLMLEPLTITSFLLEYMQNPEVEVTYQIKPSSEGSLYQVTYRHKTTDINAGESSGELKQLIGPGKYELKLTETAPVRKTVRILLKAI